MRSVALLAGVLFSAVVQAADLSAGDAARITECISNMQRSTLRADSGAYMRSVDTSDPVFAEEQRKWAKDLRTHPVDSVKFVADLANARMHRGDAWVVPLAIRWTLPDESNERAVSFDGLFRPLGLSEGVWVFAGRVWDEHAGENVRLLTAPGDDTAAEMAEYLADHVGTFRGAIEADFGEVLSMEPTIKIYPDMESLQASIGLGYTEPLGGWNEPGESIKLLSRAGFVGPRLDATVAHELGHAVSFEWGDAIIDAPWWSLEGIAEVAADPFRGERFAGARDAASVLARAGQLKPFGQLADFRGEAMNHARHVYVQGRSMVAYITERFGRETRNDWFRAMGAGGSLEDATLGVLGIPFDRLDSDWRGTLADD
jgi:hypothetical protein